MAEKAKSDCEVLLNHVMEFAIRMLERYEEFYPFGAAMTPGGAVVCTASYNGREKPLPAELVDLLRAGFRQGAVEGSYMATALAYDGLLTLPGESEKIDAVGVELDHQDDFSVVMHFPYRLVKEKPQFEERVLQEGSGQIFSPHEG